MAIERARATTPWRVVVVNNAWQRLPLSDALYACDAKWWDLYHAQTRAAFAGERWTRNPDAAKRYGLRYIRSAKAPGLTTDPNAINEGGNSGFQAINLAYLFGARRILLVGYDMQDTYGRKHFFGDHPRPLVNPASFKAWRARFAPLALDLAAAGVVVKNCSIESALEHFPRANLEDELAWFKS